MVDSGKKPIVSVQLPGQQKAKPAGPKPIRKKPEVVSTYNWRLKYTWTALKIEFIKFMKDIVLIITLWLL